MSVSITYIPAKWGRKARKVHSSFLEEVLGPEVHFSCFRNLLKDRKSFSNSIRECQYVFVAVKKEQSVKDGVSLFGWKSSITLQILVFW